MDKKELDFDEVLSYLEKLPYNKFKEVVSHYASHTRANFETELEAQKGSRSLISYLGKEDEREPRYGRKPSKYGVMFGVRYSCYSH